MPNLLRIVAFVIAIPLLGFFTGFFIESAFENSFKSRITQSYGSSGKKLAKVFSLKKVCSVPSIYSKISSSCDHLSSMLFLKNGSLLIGIGGLALIGFIFMIAKVSKNNRKVLAKLFKPGLNITLGVLFIIIIAQGAIATYSVYLIESYAIGRVHFILIGGIGIGALIGAWMMIGKASSIPQKATVTISGKSIQKNSNNDIWEFVEELASSLNARPPKNIIVGLEPNFFITSADVVTEADTRRYYDETLFLSLPMMRLFSKDELAAVIGHELGHFKGDDLAYSQKFYPIYAGSGQALKTLSEKAGDDEGLQALALLPAIAVLSFFIEKFNEAEAEIGRGREFEADKAGMQVSSPNSLATALMKVSVLAPIWSTILEKMAEYINEDKSLQNASVTFNEVALATVKDKDSIDFSSFENHQITHPTDTHPPTASRIKEMGFDSEVIQEEALKIPEDNSSIELIKSVEELEKELTDLETQKIVLYLEIARMIEEGDTGEISDKKDSEEMSIQEICDNLNNMDDNVSVGFLSSMIKRLYEIAFYDHHTSDEDRELALKLLDPLKKDVEASLENNSEARQALQEANKFMEENVKYNGYGSLAWLLEENDIPKNKILDFIMLPEHEHLLPDFFDGPGKDSKNEIMSDWIVGLLNRKTYGEIANSVIELHGLARKNDTAARSIFSKSEFDGFFNADTHYKEAREVLVNYGLLPDTSDSPGFPNDPNLEDLIVFVIQSVTLKESPGGWEEDESLNKLYIDLEDEKKNLIDLSAMVIRINLWLDLIKDVYGEAKANSAKDKLLENFPKSKEHGIEDLFKTLDICEKFSYHPDFFQPGSDHLVAMGLMQYFEAFNESEKVSESEESLLRNMGYMINLDRVHFMLKMRYMLRSIDLSESQEEINYNPIIEDYIFSE
jgi:Zn-dependent protease with chaperone function